MIAGALSPGESAIRRPYPVTRLRSPGPWNRLPTTTIPAPSRPSRGSSARVPARSTTPRWRRSSSAARAGPLGAAPARDHRPRAVHHGPRAHEGGREVAHPGAGGLDLHGQRVERPRRRLARRLPGALRLAGGGLVADPARRGAIDRSQSLRHAHRLPARGLVRGAGGRRRSTPCGGGRAPRPAVDRRLRADDHRGRLPARRRPRVVAPHRGHLDGIDLAASPDVVSVTDTLFGWLPDLLADVVPGWALFPIGVAILLGAFACVRPRAAGRRLRPASNGSRASRTRG